MRCRRSSSLSVPRRGMVAIMATISLTVLLMATALALDGGAMLVERRHAQETADAAALAAAIDLYQHYPLNGGNDKAGTAKKSAQTAATANGYSNDGTSSTVTIHIPPTAGNFVGQAGYAEVIVTYQQPRTLSTIFGSGRMPVTARAVGRGGWVPPNPQIIIFDLAAASSLLVTNNLGTINVLSGPVVVNSSDPSAATNNTTANFSAPSFRVTGGMVGNFTGPKTLGVRPTPDPLSYLPPPTSDVTGSPLSVQSSVAVTYNNANPPPNPLPQGIYQGGITVTDDGVTPVNLTLQPNGTYVMQGGGFSFTSTGNFTGNGVLIYNQPTVPDGGQSLSIAGPVPSQLDPFNPNPPPPGTITLSPLTTGPYQGITIFQQQSAIDTMFLFGNGNTTITGTIYAANARVNVSTQSYNTHNDVCGTQFMSRKLQLAGLSTYTLTQLPQPAMQRIIGLVE
jgi:Putative Flp pilus-assembly TadE/G-like